MRAAAVDLGELERSEADPARRLCGRSLSLLQAHIVLGSQIKRQAANPPGRWFGFEKGSGLQEANGPQARKSCGLCRQNPLSMLRARFRPGPLRSGSWAAG